MANHYRNYLIIRGATDKLQLFKNNALPNDHEQVDNSWCGHGEGPLSFLSLCPPPPELRNQKGTSACEYWREMHWGGYFPELTNELDDRSLQENVLIFPFFLTRCASSHNFVFSVSRLFPELIFHLVWWDVYEGVYGTPKRYALLVVSNGVIAMDYVELPLKVLQDLAPDTIRAYVDWTDAPHDHQDEGQDAPSSSSDRSDSTNMRPDADIPIDDIFSFQ